MTLRIPSLWLCADLDHPAAGELVARVTAVLAVTPACVWLRGGAASARTMLVAARALRAVTRGEGSALVVGDRLDVAALGEADGVHLPGRGVSPEDARRLARGWLSAAVHDAADVEAARGRVEVMVLSPFGAVPGKGPALGAEGFAALRGRAGDATVIALGGVTTPSDVAAALRAGADGVAVRRALLDSDDPATVCAALAEPIGRRGD